MHFANLLIGLSLVPLIKLVTNNLRMDELVTLGFQI